MLEARGYPVFRHRIGDVVREALDLGDGVAHGHAHVHLREEREVILRVTEAIGHSHVVAKMREDRLYAGLLGVAREADLRILHLEATGD